MVSAIYLTCTIHLIAFNLSSLALQVPQRIKVFQIQEDDRKVLDKIGSFGGNLVLSKDKWVEFDICRVLKMFEGGPPILKVAHREDQFKNLIAIFSRDVYWEEISLL